MNRTKIAFAVLAAALAVAEHSDAGQQAPPATTIDAARIAFGYTDRTGTKLLSLNETDETRTDNSTSEAFANTLVSAVCAEGQILPIRFLRKQPLSPASNGRQGAGNFENEAGALFEILSGHAEASDTCMLVPAGYVAAFPVASNELPKRERESGNSAYWREIAGNKDIRQPADPFRFHTPGDFARSSIKALEAAKSRTVKLYWPLHRNGSAQEVAAIEFTPEGDSLLGSLVLLERGRQSFLGWPASLQKGAKDGGCWRVDDECRFPAAGMAVPAILGAPGGQLIFYTAHGAEGQVILLLQARGDTLVELKRAYRYQSPL